ncbi:MAG: glycosyltransferase family 39 protein [Chloroflexi bacterium]|nr:glycosyltransferase family 39 protein [Chloroflexota bacterium]
MDSRLSTVNCRLRHDRWLVALLVGVAIASRVFTHPLYANEPSSDEYFYGFYAIELARALLGLSDHGLNDLAANSRFIGLLVASALPIVPLDPISLGRTLQALCNAATVPLVYALGRAIGLPPQPSFAAAVLLLAMPETWETAWRFWPDSQAALLALASLLALVRLVQRPGLARALVAPLLLAATFLTKEYAAVATLPALVGGGGLAAVSLLLGGRRRSGRRALLALALVALPVVLAAMALLGAPRLLDLLKPTPLYGPAARTLLPANRLLAQLASLDERLPDYLAALSRQFGPSAFGAGFVLFWAIGTVVLVATAARALLAGRTRPWRAALWALVLVLWAPGLFFGWALAWELVQGSVVALAILVLGAALASASAFRSAQPASSPEGFRASSGGVEPGPVGRASLPAHRARTRHVADQVVEPAPPGRCVRPMPPGSIHTRAAPAATSGMECSSLSGWRCWGPSSPPSSCCASSCGPPPTCSRPSRRAHSSPPSPRWPSWPAGGWPPPPGPWPGPCSGLHTRAHPLDRLLGRAGCPAWTRWRSR